MEGTSPNRRFSLHDLYVDYLRRQTPDDAAALHNQLLDGYARLTDGWHNELHDPYFFDRLAYHVALSRNHDRMRALLEDKAFFRSFCLHHKDVNTIYDALKALLALARSDGHRSPRWKNLSFPDHDERAWYRHYHAEDLKSFSLCLQLHYVAGCGEQDPETRCTRCDALGSIIHGTIDTGGVHAI